MQVPAEYLEAADGRMVGCFYPHASPMLRMFENVWNQPAEIRWEFLVADVISC